MSRRVISSLFFFWLPALASAAILPEALGDFRQTAVQPFTPAEQAVFAEYGFDAGEKSQYAAGERRLEITAVRAKDPTGAFAMYQWLRPAGGKTVSLGERAVESGDTTVFQFGNYVFILRGAKPDEEPLQMMLAVLPRLERTAAPTLPHFLPAQGLMPNSERYVLGPVVLAKLAGAIPPSVAAFHLGAEGQIAEYSAAGGRLKLALFSYPTPQVARAQLEEFQKLPDVVAKRSGPIIAAVVSPFSRDEAEKLLAGVRYEATLTWNERGFSRRDNVADLLLNILLLIAIITGFMVAAGVALGGARVLLSKLLPGSRFDAGAGRDFIRLHLSD